MHRILANENVPRAVVTALREAGHDVLWVRETSPGASDHEVILRARAEGRVILTIDADYVWMIFKAGVPTPPSLVHIRVRARKPSTIADRVAALFRSASPEKLHGAVTVIEDSSAGPDRFHIHRRCPLAHENRRPAPFRHDHNSGANPRLIVFSQHARGSTNCSRYSRPPALLPTPDMPKPPNG